MQTKTSALKLAIFENPPYYEHEIITNLEELSLSSSEGNKNFEHISNALDKASSQLISTIECEAEKSRIQSTIENERIANGISETNYRLLDVASGIEELDDSIFRSSMVMKEAISSSSKEISERLEEGLSSIYSELISANLKLENISNKMDVYADITRRSFAIMSSQLDNLIRIISAPNETKALELANQARQNIALNKKDIALSTTMKALKISNGTSITVLAYHILTLSLFDDESSIKKMKNYYIDYVNLVEFKLTDNFSDSSIILKEINETVYSVMSVMGHRIDNNIMLLTQKLYRYLINSKYLTSSILQKPLHDENTLEMITYANPLRELHWSILLKNTVLVSDDIDIYVRFITSLMKNKVLIKNEILYIASKKFYEKHFLDTVIMSKKIQNNIGVIDTLEIISSVIPNETLLANKLSLENTHNLINFLEYINFLKASKIINRDKLITLAVKHCYDNGFLYSAIVDGLADNNDNMLNNALKTIVLLLPKDIIKIDSKTYWMMHLYAKRHNIEVNSLLQFKFEEAIAHVSADLNQRYVIVYDNLHQQIQNKEDEIISQKESIHQKHNNEMQSNLSEWNKHNKDIDDKEYPLKIRKLEEADKNRHEEYLPVVMPIITFIIVYYTIDPQNQTSTSLTIILSIVASFVSLLISIDFPSKIQYSRYKKFEKYKEELGKKYKISEKKRILDIPYLQALSDLETELKDYRNNLSIKLDQLLNETCNRYIDDRTEIEKVKNIMEKEAPIYGKTPADL